MFAYRQGNQAPNLVDASPDYHDSLDPGPRSSATSAVFILASVAAWVGGRRLPMDTDAIARRTGLGAAFLGVLFAVSRGVTVPRGTRAGTGMVRHSSTDEER